MASHPRSRAEQAIGGRIVPCPGLRRDAVIVASLARLAAGPWAPGTSNHSGGPPVSQVPRSPACLGLWNSLLLDDIRAVLPKWEHRTSTYPLPTSLRSPACAVRLPSCSLLDAPVPCVISQLVSPTVALPCLSFLSSYHYSISRLGCISS